MGLQDSVRVARRFQRSVRIDTDLELIDSLKGFVCPQSSLDVLGSMARHAAENEQGAFTWTGPYGSGKSSLVIALSALLSGNIKSRKIAASIVSEKVANQLWSALPPKARGWNILPVVGRRDHPAQVIGEAIEASQLSNKKYKKWKETDVLETLKIIAHNSSKHGGLIVFIDEMGKFLEGAAIENSDVYLFQQLAEIASRSKNRLIIVGILHQSFEEYGRQLSRQMRDEWTKIQGRFVDLSVNAAGEEQIELLSRAIESSENRMQNGITQEIVNTIKNQRPHTSQKLADTLDNCWPLHPVTTCLLGPISKRRFGQNQRSIFGFLNSAENYGFQHFLSIAEEDTLFEPHLLWEYLRVNLEPAILASPDGHRWALAADSVERCDAAGATELQLELLKSIAIIDLFRERSGLLASLSLLQACTLGKFSKTELVSALGELKAQSFIIYKKHLDAYAIFAGSDFDIEQAVENALYEVRGVDFGVLKELANLQPILAKRHFHEKGTLRWFDVDLVPLKNLQEEAENYVPNKGTIGQFLLAIPTENETKEDAQDICAKVAAQMIQRDVIIGLSDNSWAVKDRARELIAIDKVRQESPELAGDNIARREVSARLVNSQNFVEAELAFAFDNAIWFLSSDRPTSLRYSQLNGLASQLSDQRFPDAPRLNNELLNRHKPSSSAVAAQNALLKNMVSQSTQQRLGIEGFSSEGGLYVSLLQSTKLHVAGNSGWKFVKPVPADVDLHNLSPLWACTEKYLKENSDRTVKVSEIYEIWRSPPYGVRDGLMPIIAVAFILSCQDTVALYREGIYQANFKDLDVEYLTIDPAFIQIRWMDLSGASRKLLSGMAEIVRDLDPDNGLQNLKPIDVARGLISIFDGVAPWTMRTSYLSKNALRLRDIFKKANDPNQLIFNDLPTYSEAQIDQFSEEGMSNVVNAVKEGLAEIVGAYSSLLERFYQVLIYDLGVANTSSQSLFDLRERARNIRGVAGDFKLDAFAGRLANFEGTVEEIEGLASLTVSKPLNSWIDADADRAMIEIAKLSRQFNKAEAFAHIKGRKNKRSSIAIITSINGRSSPVVGEFDIGDADQASVQDAIVKLETVLSQDNGFRKEVVLAALAELSTRYISSVEKEQINSITVRAKN
ncbi:ATP-binding protein [Alphaproteobacteria bacterium 46_93_T64]|nr:ATP-binding protein [Alphaproteobacteria bacterium 46_93_T64]